LSSGVTMLAIINQIIHHRVFRPNAPFKYNADLTFNGIGGVFWVSQEQELAGTNVQDAILRSSVFRTKKITAGCLVDCLFFDGDASFGNAGYTVQNKTVMFCPIACKGARSGFATALRMPVVSLYQLLSQSAVNRGF